MKNQQRQEQRAALSSPLSQITFTICSECGIPKEGYSMNSHWQSYHPQLYENAKLNRLLCLKKDQLPKNPDDLWADKVMKKLDQYQREEIDACPYFKKVRKSIYHLFSFFFQVRRNWSLKMSYLANAKVKYSEGKELYAEYVQQWKAAAAHGSSVEMKTKTIKKDKVSSTKSFSKKVRKEQQCRSQQQKKKL